MTARLAMLLCAVFFLPVPDSARAAVSDAAAIPVQTLTDALLKSMRAGTTISMAERYKQLEPVVEQVFAMPLVTRLAVGPQWASFPPDQIDDNVLSRGDDKVVRTRVIPAHDVPVSLLYRMHEVDGTWKIIDVISDGVSQLALRRSDFAVAIAAGGAPALIAHLNKSSEALLK